jgi:phage terminase large subunit
MKARKRVIQGGTSAGKTYAIIPILIDKALKKGRLKITVVAETLPAVKEGALDIFKTIMEDTGRWIDSNWNASSLTYTFGNKTRVQFKSFDTEGKAKASGKRDILFLNEANHIAFPIADALIIRSIETYIDFNPDNEFWVHTEVLPEHNSEFLLLTYLDNEGLSKETLEDLLIKKKKAETSSYWANWWKVYGEGQIGNLQGVVFDNWKQIDTIPNDAKLVGRGMDFGFTNDPTTCIDIYEYNNEFIFDERIYKTGLTNPDIWREFKTLGIDNNIYTVADSAEPKSIKELSSLGMRIIGAEKGKDSILFGIQRMQEIKFKVTSSSLNLIKELRSYTWAVDKEGNKLNKPIDNFNHAIDAIRYYFNSKPKAKAPRSRLIRE